MLVLMDTSILMYLAETPSSFVDELRAKVGSVEFAVPDAVLRELASLSGSGGVRGKRARLALVYARTLRGLPRGGEADDALISLAQEREAYVATLDRELAHSLRRKGIPVATMRNFHLALIGTG